MEDFKSLLCYEFAPYGELTAEQLDRLERHYQLVLRWNQRINLTRITNLREAVLYHYCESLYLARSLPPEQLKIVDIGSGAGFPGVPVAVYRPDCSVHLVESHKRRAVFLSEAIRELSLPNVEVFVLRAQELSEQYDCLISRAVDPEEVLDLRISKSVSILGNMGEKLPWGEDRCLFHVEQFSKFHVKH